MDSRHKACKSFEMYNACVNSSNYGKVAGADVDTSLDCSAAKQLSKAATPALGPAHKR